MINRKKAIPVSLNMSLGLIPAIICMVASEFITTAYALFGSALISLLFSLVSFYISKKRIYNFILYITTATLCIFSLFILIPINMFPQGTISFSIEIIIIMLNMILFYRQASLKKLFNKKACSHCDDLITKSIDSSVVSARIIFIMGVLHFITATLFMLFGYPLSESTSSIIYQILPPVLFTISIGVNQVGIYFANRIIDDGKEMPIVDKKGNVIGRHVKTEASPSNENDYINPIIRIAFVYDDMLFLCNHKSTESLNKNQVDIPLETSLQFGEDLDTGIQRLISEVYPESSAINPRFSIKHHLKTKEMNRLIYLYIAYITDNELLCNPHYQEGKLWTFQQIEQNLDKGYFSECFENEYEHLKQAVTLWQEFK